jgi:uncharacterized protein (TIRG00374 family)
MVIAMIGAGGLLLAMVDVSEVGARLRQADWRYLAGASAALLAGLAVYAERWHGLLGPRVGRRAAFHAANVGHALNVLVPLRAGEAARIVTLARTTVAPLSHVAASVVLERLFEQVMRMAALGGAVVFGLGLTVSPLTILAGFAFVGAGFGALAWLARSREALLVAWPPWLARLPGISRDRAAQLLTGLLGGVHAAGSPAQMALTLIWSLVLWTCAWAYYALALRAVSGTLDTGDMLTLSLGALALAPPSAPAAPGIYHAAVVVPLSVLGYDENMMTAFAVIAHAVQMGWMLGLGLLGLGAAGGTAEELLARAARPGGAPSIAPASGLADRDQHDALIAGGVERDGD